MNKCEVIRVIKDLPRVKGEEEEWKCFLRKEKHSPQSSELEDAASVTNACLHETPRVGGGALSVSCCTTTRLKPRR